MRGGWARDLAYALSSHLVVEDRRAWERDLIARHGDRLAEAGVAPPEPEAAFLAYRQCMTHAAWIWLGTIDATGYSPRCNSATSPLRRCIEPAQPARISTRSMPSRSKAHERSRNLLHDSSIRHPGD